MQRRHDRQTSENQWNLQHYRPTVYSNFDSEPGVAWTLIQSHSFQNNDAFNTKAFYLHDMPINQDAPEWNNYRLSMSRMKSVQDVSTHWRATCNFLTDGVDYCDYWRVSLKNLDLFMESAHGLFCLFSEFVIVRGNECANCTVWTAYSSKFSFTLTAGLAKNEAAILVDRQEG